VRADTERDQPVCVDAGSGLGENAVNHGVDGGIPSDAESDQRDGGCAEGWRFGQNPGGGTEVLEELLDSRPNPDGACGFFHQADVAEFADSGGAGLGGRFAARNAVLRRHVQMRLDLIVEVVISLAHRM